MIILSSVDLLAFIDLAYLVKLIYIWSFSISYCLIMEKLFWLKSRLRKHGNNHGKNLEILVASESTTFSFPYILLSYANGNQKN